MGSPNFYTGNELLLNFALDGDCDESCDGYCDCGMQNDLSNTYKLAEDFISSLPTLYFHKIELNSGYHQGFQVYLSQERTVAGVVYDWDKYKEFSDIDGYNVDIYDCGYFRANVKNATEFNVQYAVKCELAALSELLTDFARSNSLGEVVGYTWTSSVCYDWLATTPKAA